MTLGMQHTGSEGGDLLTSSDVARLAGVAAETVRAWERAGKLRARRTVSGTRLFQRADVVAFIRQREGK